MLSAAFAVVGEGGAGLPVHLRQEGLEGSEGGKAIFFPAGGEKQFPLPKKKSKKRREGGGKKKDGPMLIHALVRRKKGGKGRFYRKSNRAKKGPEKRGRHCPTMKIGRETGEVPDRLLMGKGTRKGGQKRGGWLSRREGFVICVKR